MGVIDYHQLPNLDLFGIFSFHFALATWALAGLGSNYLFYNIVFLIVLIWCVKDTQNEIPLILAIRINLMSLAFDIVVLAWYVAYKDVHFFVISGAILHWLLRFITVPLLSKMCSDKTGGLNDGLPPAFTPIFGVDPASGARDPYENIDAVPHQSYPKSEPVIGSSQSYNFTSNVPTYQA